MTARRRRGGRRAYSPRRTTVDLIARILERPGIAHVHTIAPSHGSHYRPTMLRVVLEDRGGNGDEIRTDFTLPDARAWLAAEIKAEEEGL